MNFFDELKRRNVFRVAGVYAVVGWLLAQAAALLESALSMPGWFDTVVVCFLLIGFPLALVFAWAFELTPEGVKPTVAVAPGESIAARTGRKLDYAILGGLALVAVVVLIDRLMPGRAAVAPEAASAVAAVDAASPGNTALPDEKSIAVLPFVDMSPDSDQGYFADGLSEELLNVLAKSRELKVAGRTSSFAFKGQNRDLREVGEILNVANVLEGSVRKAGDRIRVTAQLVKARDGYHIFSETYDRELSDVFAVQDDIAGKIGAALKTELIGTPSEEAAPSDFQAYDLYLLARQRIYSRDRDQLKEASDLLDRALALDPEYAPAYAQKSIVTMLLSDSAGTYGDIPYAEAVGISQKYIDKALAIDPDLAEAHAALGLQRLNGGARLEQIRAPLERALSINPNLTDAQHWLAIALLTDGQPKETRKIYEEVATRDPLFGPALNNLTFDYATTGDFDKAEALISRVERTRGGETADTTFARGQIAFNRGDLAEAVVKLGANPKPSNVHKILYVETLVLIGDLQTAYDLAAEEQKIVILCLMDRCEEALTAIEAWPSPSYGESSMLQSVFSVFALMGQYEAAAQYLTRNFGDLTKAAEAEPFNASLWLGPLGRAYKKLGRRRDLDETIAMFRDVLAREDDAGADGMYTWLAKAELAVLEGNDDLAIDCLKRTITKGWYGIYGFYQPTFDDLRDDPRFKALEAEMRVKANAARVKLGMKPL
ncbi:MAG: adenylyl cyclase [Pseudomonadota bacterium]|nr:adenylyl cyclase [Pseudomonadota bacterium]